MTMMGSGSPKKGGAADDAIALIRVAANEEKYTARIAELERLKAEGEAARAEAIKAQQAADQERQAALAAANLNAERLQELREASAKLAKEQEAFKAHMTIEQVALGAGKKRLMAERQTMLNEANTTKQLLDHREGNLATRESVVAEKEEAMKSALAAAMQANNKAQALKATYTAKLAKLGGILAEETVEGR